MRLIDADALWLKTQEIKIGNDKFIGEVVFLEDIANAPTIDAEPVKHGEWEQHDGCVLCKDDDTYFYTCSCCKMAITEAERGLFNYCPNCGADMRGEEE